MQARNSRSPCRSRSALSLRRPTALMDEMLLLPAGGKPMNSTERIGVYICHCGTNIAGTVDVEAVANFAAGLEGVAVARHYAYMCSDPGQALIQDDVRDQGLNRVVVASCSPLMHEVTFRRA